MLFNSFEFIFFFLPFVFFIYFYLNKKRLTEAAKAFLVFASLFFYSWWNINYLPLILISILVNYTVGRELAYHKHRKRRYSAKKLLSVGIVFNLALLAYYKYTDFFIENLDHLLGSNISLLHLALPLAISFYTFQQISYLVDSYKEETKEYDFLNYTLFVTFFPQLIAGPIVHHAEMMPQFAKKRNKVKNYYNIALGVFVFSIGLFKKVVIADTFAEWANYGFDVAHRLNMLEAWISSLSYTFQLYFDFSGYTDMAIGAALLFNIKLPINFFSPYKSVSIQDFWRRWHITLSRFLKSYLYIPLGGNRKGQIRTYLNLFITFLLGGIWHGAGWTFLFWGALHGAALVIHRVWKQLGFKMPQLLALFVTFNFINFTWVFFRAKNFDDALKVLKGMFFGEHHIWTYLQKLYDHGNPIAQWFNLNSDSYGNTFNLFAILMVTVGLFVIFLFPNSNELATRMNTQKRVSLPYTILTIVALGTSLLFMSISHGTEFLYFNF